MNTQWIRNSVLCAAASATLLPLSLLASPATAADGETKPATHSWSSLITVEQLHQRLGEPKLLILDAREPADYAAGHIPGAINLPGSQWRTPATKVPSKEGPGQKIFRTAHGALDVARYEQLLSAAGIAPDSQVVVYGNHAGKADGSVAATILLKLGHKSVVFVDGVGLDLWKKAGYPISTEARKLAASNYQAHPDAKKLWSTKDVLEHLHDDDVVIIDSRSIAEYEGKDLRGNKRGGHIPGAKLLPEEGFLDKDTKQTIGYDEAKAKIEKLVPKDKKVVIYCQSGTRCSHKELLFKDLGYKDVVLYDASWQEWGNLEDTPVEQSEPAADAPATAADKPTEKAADKPVK